MLFKNIKNKLSRKGKKYNFSLLAEVGALVFLGISEHPMNIGRWFVLSFVIICSLISFFGNE